MQHRLYIGSILAGDPQRERVELLRSIGFPVNDAVADQILEYDDGDNGVQPTITCETFVYEMRDGKKRKVFNSRQNKPLHVRDTFDVSQIPIEDLARWKEVDTLEARITGYDKAYLAGHAAGEEAMRKRVLKMIEDFDAFTAASAANEILDEVLANEDKS